jgi:cytochrome P450
MVDRPHAEERWMSDVVIDTFAEARETYRQKQLRQGLYDEGAVVMDGVLLNLHGDEHRRRRRLESRMFRRDTFEHYERDLFPGILEKTLQPYLTAGHADLTHLGHELLLNLAAPTAGIDRPIGDAAETERLYQYVRVFVEGSQLHHSTQDHTERAMVVQEQLQQWKSEFLNPSTARRRKLVARLDAGELDESELPRDILTALLRNVDDLELDDATLTREVAFFLLAAAHTSATAFERTIDHALDWVDAHPEDRQRLISDRLFVQKCVHETIRLNPSSPIGLRRALEDITLHSGRKISAGDLVTIDLAAVNRDESTFGEDAAQFDPRRRTPDGVAPFGLSFAAGMHVCIGQDLAAGVVASGDDDPGDSHLFGLVPVAVQRMFKAGVRRDPGNPPVADPTTTRPYWSSYPVLLGS